MDPRPGLYVHVPFCASICPYCDFSVVRSGHPLRGRYVDLLLSEAERVAGDGVWGAGDPFGTVYLGGGTPSALSAEELGRLRDGLRSRLDVAVDARWSLEANPEDVDSVSAADWVGLGFSYVSLGAQSTDAEALRFLGRRHDAGQVGRAVRALRGAGVTTVSVDLIFGFDLLGAGGWETVLDQVVDLEPDHLSCYELTVHEGTAFWRLQREGRLGLSSEDRRAELFRATAVRLAAAGYELYEVSNYARGRRHRSPHNQKYWHGVPYLGIGPSAHSFDGGRRWWNRRSLGAWAGELGASRSPMADLEVLTPDQIRMEWLLTRLRTVEGLDLEDHRRRFGTDLMDAHGPAVEELSASGLVRLESGRLLPTLEGLAVADAVVLALAGQ